MNVYIVCDEVSADTVGYDPFAVVVAATEADALALWAGSQSAVRASLRVECLGTTDRPKGVVFRGGEGGFDQPRGAEAPAHAPSGVELAPGDRVLLRGHSPERDGAYVVGSDGEPVERHAATLVVEVGARPEGIVLGLPWHVVEEEANTERIWHRLQGGLNEDGSVTIEVESNVNLVGLVVPLDKLIAFVDAIRQDAAKIDGGRS